MKSQPDRAVHRSDPQPSSRIGQVELASQESIEDHHFDASEVAEELIEQGHPQVARALHQLANLLQTFEAAGFAEQLPGAAIDQEGPAAAAQTP